MTTNRTVSMALEPCPFCGGTAEIEHDTPMPGAFTLDAIAAWNHRASRTQEPAEPAYIVALNSSGDERATLRIAPDEPWPITEVIDTLVEWAETDDDRVIALRAASISPAAQQETVGVRVKPLEWVKHETANIWRAFSILGTHHVIAIKDKPAWTFDGNDGSRAEGLCETADEAKAAAQADYDRRIRSALAPASHKDGEAVACTCRGPWPPGFHEDHCPLHKPQPPVPETITDAAFENHQWPLGLRVTKAKGAAWTGRIVGYYSTALTPVGYAVESENEPGSVQIYPVSALSVKPQNGEAE